MVFSGRYGRQSLPIDTDRPDCQGKPIIPNAINVRQSDRRSLRGYATHYRREASCCSICWERWSEVHTRPTILAAAPPFLNLNLPIEVERMQRKYTTLEFFIRGHPRVTSMVCYPRREKECQPHARFPFAYRV